MAQLKIQIYPPQFLNEVGKRENNEDNIYPAIGEASIEDRLFLVCDGVGGSSKGEIASKIVCESIGAFIKGNLEKKVDADFLTEALRSAEKNLSLHTQKNPACKGMKTTLTLLWFRPEGAWVAWCGDSRVYQFRNGRILYKTEDHSLVNKLLKEGQITAKEAENHPHGNVILRAIAGANEPAELDVVLLEDVQSYDQFMLCSDGITEKLNDTNLEELSSLDDVEMMQEQIGQFCETFSRDNYSMYLIGIENAEQIEETTKATAIVPEAKPVEETVETPAITPTPSTETTTEINPPTNSEKATDLNNQTNSEKANNSTNVNTLSRPTENPKNSNFLTYILGGLSLIAVLVGLFSFLGFKKKKAVQSLIEKANVLQQNNELDSAMHYLSLAKEKNPDNQLITQSMEEIEVRIERKEKAESVNKAHDAAIQTMNQKMSLVQNDTSINDSIKNKRLLIWSLKKDALEATHQFSLGEKEKAYELLEWKDTLPETRRIFSYQNWELLANLYGLFADGDSTKLARQEYCERFLQEKY